MQRSDRNWFKLPEAGLKTCWTGVIYKNDKRESFKRRKVKYPVMPRSSILRSEFSHFCVPLYNIVYRWKIAWKKRRYDRASQEKCPTLTVFYVNHNRAVLWSGNERKIGIIRYDNKIRQHCCNLFCWPAKLGDQMFQPVSNCLLCVQITNILPDSITDLFMKQVRILRQRTSGEISLKNQSISMFTYQQIHNINYVYMFNSERVFK